MINQNQNQQPRTQLFEALIIIVCVGIAAIFVSGWQPPDTKPIAEWLWSIFLWGMGIAGGLAALTIAWYAPQLWHKRRVAITMREAELNSIARQDMRGNLEIESMKADIAAKFERMEIEKAKIHAEIRAMSYRIEQISPSKSIIALDTNQADPIAQARLLAHPPKEQGGEMGMSSDELPNMIDIMLKPQCQRMLLIAPSGAGKTNILKHYCSQLGDRKAIIIDPHSESCEFIGKPVVGSGLRFSEIESTMLWLMHDIEKGYQEGNIAQNGDLGDDNRWIIIDEWKDILANVGIAGEFLEMMMIRSRKRGYRMLIINQNDTAKSFGLEGNMDLLKTCARFSIDFDMIDDSRKAIFGWEKAKQRELAVPPIFEGFPEIREEQIWKQRAYSQQEARLIKAMIKLNWEQEGMSKSKILAKANIAKNGQNVKKLQNLMLELKDYSVTGS